MRSDIQHRSDAVIDQLTGMLNRKSAQLARRRACASSRQLTGESVGMHRRRPRSLQEHQRHARALRRRRRVASEVAYRLRKQLRAFDLAYRLGGEEFLILLPGSDLRRVRRASPSSLRERVATDDVSAGAARRDDELRRRRLQAGRDVRATPRSSGRADAALYEAKRSWARPRSASRTTPARASARSTLSPEPRSGAEAREQQLLARERLAGRRVDRAPASARPASPGR